MLCLTYHSDAISIEQSLAQSIKLQPYKIVTVKVVQKKVSGVKRRYL